MGRVQLNNDKSGDLAEQVRLAQAGDELALHRLISQTQKRLLRFVYFLCGDATLAQDLCQETYLYAFQHLRQLKEPAAFGKWLFLIAKNRLLDHRKSPRNKAHDPIEKIDALGTFSKPADQELWAQVRQALVHLPEEDRLLLLLVDLEGYTYAEAAHALKISESSITSKIYRAREAFHRIYFKP